MDLKGITWVGNVYQKFEALCLEVEDNMYEDTVKYVENQVQTVGASVKKFYSDVLQDILPLLETDPVKTSATDLSIENYTGPKMYKKPKLCSKEEDMKVDVVKNTQDSNVVADVVKHAGHRSFAGEPHSLSYRLRPSNVANAISCAEKDLVRPSSAYEFHKIASERINAASRPDSDLIVGSELKDDEIEEIDERSSGGNASANNGANDVSAGLSSSNIRSALSDASTEHSGMLQQNGLISPVYHTIDAYAEHTELEDVEPASTEGLMTDADFGSADGWDANPFEEDDEIELGMESSYVIDAVKLHEYFVLMDGAKPCFVPQKDFKQKSYKKKLRDAIFLKKKSPRNREYEQLAAQFQDIQAGSSVSNVLPICPTDSKTKVLKCHDTCESEWELL